MAHKKGQGSSRNGRDSNAQHRGVKAYSGQAVSAGSVIVRQLGTCFFPGKNTKLGRDFSIFALTDGIVRFSSGARPRIHVDPFPEQAN